MGNKRTVSVDRVLAREQLIAPACTRLEQLFLHVRQLILQLLVHGVCQELFALISTCSLGIIVRFLTLRVVHECHGWLLQWPTKPNAPKAFFLPHTQPALQRPRWVSPPLRLLLPRA